MFTRQSPTSSPDLSVRRKLRTAVGLLGAVGVLALTGSALGAPHVLHVAPDGSGTTCSEASPCDVAAAQAEARAVKGSVDDDVIVRLGAGTYYLSDPLTLTDQDSGVNGHRVIWEALECGTTLSAGLPLSGWTLHDAGMDIWAVPVPDGFDSRQLFVNDQRAARARTPGDQTTTGTEISDLSSPDFWGMTQDGSSTSVGVSSFRNIDRVEAIMRFNWWRVERCPLSGASGDWMSFRQPCGQWAYTSEQRQVYYIENAYELLDAEGEWYLDPTVDTVYYKPRSGEDMASAVAVAGRLERILHVNGASNVTVRGLTLAHSTWMFPSGDMGYTGWQGGYIYTPDGGYYMATPGAVLIEHANDVVLERNRIAHIGSSAVSVHSGSRGTQVVGNVIEDVSGHCVEVGHKDDDPSNAVVGTTVANNIIRFCAVEFQDNHGVHVPRAEDVYILHNELNDFPYSAVGIGWGWSPDDGWWGGIRINDNEIWNSTLRGSDGGGIYAMSSQRGTQGQGSELMRNYLHDYGDPGRKHIGTGYMHGGHLYIEDGAGHYRVQNNVATTTTRWLFTWASNNHDNDIQYNWSDTSSSQNSIDGFNNNVIANNQVVTDGNWPREARAVMEGAGIEAAYEDIRSGCAPIGGVGGSGGAAGSGGSAGSGGEPTVGGSGGSLATGGAGAGGTIGIGGAPSTGSGGADQAGTVGVVDPGTGTPVDPVTGEPLPAGTGGSAAAPTGWDASPAAAAKADDPAAPGCSCVAAGTSQQPGLGWLAALALGFGVLVRRPRRRSAPG